MNLKEVLKYSKSLKILYVEDDEALLAEMKDVLNEFFGEVILAKDGEEGLKLYKENIFDIVISDIQMPKMNGIELSRNIKNMNKEQEIIIISAYNDSQNLLSLIQISVSEFLLKPMEFEQMLQVFYKVSKNVFLKKENDKFLLTQSKMAMMGEMIDLVAHQWLQFVNVLSMKTELMNIENEQNRLDNEKIKLYTSEYMNELEELSETLNVFRSFFTDKEKEKIDLEKEIKNSILLLKDYLIKNLVEVEYLNIKGVELDLYPNEFKQVIINIIMNMIDNFKDRNIQDRVIKISYKDNILIIEDNGGGIKKEFIDFIFDENFTTKKYGTGKGLYLSKKIIEKLEGKIWVENLENGVKFLIKVNNGN